MRCKISGISLLLAAVVIAACGKSVARTDIDENGAWTRTITLAVPKGDGQMPMPGVADLFEVPADGDWMITEGEVGDELVYTATRSLSPGTDTKSDVAVKRGGIVIVRNEVSVTKSGNRIVYKEVVKWQGALPEEISVPAPDLVSSVTEALVGRVGSADGANEMALFLQRALWQAMFGPEEPLLGQMLSHPDLGERKFRKRMGTRILEEVRNRFEGKLDSDAMRELATVLLAAADPDTIMADRTDIESGPPNEDSALIGMSFVVAMPGRVIETNGQVDELSGEIFWGFHPEAAAAGEVVMTAECELD